jgi:4-hydroxy-tetrahydrodipicolinate synthase
MTNDFKGAGVALITPFRDYGTIDFTAFERIIEHVVSKGINYIVALGTTGESVTLSKDEKLAILDFVVETVNKRVPIVAGIGGNNTQEVINTIKSTTFDGIDAILSVSPYYNKPQQKGIYNHYKAIAGASPVPIILYNVPGRTSSNISAETTIALAHDFGNIIGIKEASGDLIQIMHIMKHKPPSFLVISGDDQLTFPLCTLGASGVISVIANAFPAEFTEMVSLAKKGKLKKSRSIHYGLLPIMNALFEDGSPAGIKAALEIMGLCSSTLRLPLVSVNQQTYKKLENLINQFQLIPETVK